MRREHASLLAELSVADIKKLLANKKLIDAVIVRKAKLEQKLAKAESDLARLLGAAGAPSKTGPRRRCSGAKRPDDRTRRSSRWSPG